jgi:Protein of unknown function (DUF1353)
MPTALELYFRALDATSTPVTALGVPSVRALDVGAPDPAENDYSPQALPPGAFRPSISPLPPVPVSYDVANETWVLLSDYTIDHQGTNLTARKDFAFDLSSVPRAFWIFIAPNELSIVAPLFHDLLYRFRGRLPAGDTAPPRTFSRKDTDLLFLDLMEVEQVPLWRRSVAYRAVRAFGGVLWTS